MLREHELAGQVYRVAGAGHVRRVAGEAA